MLEQNISLNCRGKLISLGVPRIMAILNITPDSFYDGGRYPGLQEAISRVGQMLKEGADIIDVGGMSSRPGASPISTGEELDRVIPVIEAIIARFPEVIISIDTFRAEVAREAVARGASMINDISAGRMDAEMYTTVAALQVPYVLMHMQGTPADMQLAPSYENVTEEVMEFFVRELGQLKGLGVKDIVLDVGFGFGKTISHNYQLLRRLHVFKLNGFPLLAGISRKSLIYKYLDISPEESLHGTVALNMVALQQGASILRVHDVPAARETIRLWQMLESVDDLA